MTSKTLTTVTCAHCGEKLFTSGSQNRFICPYCNHLSSIEPGGEPVDITPSSSPAAAPERIYSEADRQRLENEITDLQAEVEWMASGLASLAQGNNARFRWIKDRPDGAWIYFAGLGIVTFIMGLWQGNPLVCYIGAALFTLSIVGHFILAWMKRKALRDELLVLADLQASRSDLAAKKAELKSILEKTGVQ